VRWVATPAGSLRLPGRQARAVEQALHLLGERARRGDRLVTFPEGGFFNFVTGLANPLREEQVFPGVLDRAHELAVARRLVAARPRFVLLCSRPVGEYGRHRFGSDYDALLWSSVAREYELTAGLGKLEPVGAEASRGSLIRVFEPVGRGGGSEPKTGLRNRRDTLDTVR
jgi:hypothetical protein